MVVGGEKRSEGVSRVGECLKHVTEQGPPRMSCGEREAGGPTCAHIVVGFYFFKEKGKKEKLVFESSHFFKSYLFIYGLSAVVLMVCVTKVAKAALEKALAENEDIDGVLASPQLPIVAEPPVDLNQPLIIKIDPAEDNHEK